MQSSGDGEDKKALLVERLSLSEQPKVVGACTAIPAEISLAARTLGVEKTDSYVLHNTSWVKYSGDSPMLVSLRETEDCGSHLFVRDFELGEALGIPGMAYGGLLDAARTAEFKALIGADGGFEARHHQKSDVTVYESDDFKLVDEEMPIAYPLREEILDEARVPTGRNRDKWRAEKIHALQVSTNNPKNRREITDLISRTLSRTVNFREINSGEEHLASGIPPQEAVVYTLHLPPTMNPTSDLTGPTEFEGLKEQVFRRKVAELARKLMVEE